MQLIHLNTKKIHIIQYSNSNITYCGKELTEGKYIIPDVQDIQLHLNRCKNCLRILSRRTHV